MARPRKFDETAVLEKAMLLFWKKGYFDTSVDDLVQTLGLNRASLYNTFGGKKNLFARALELYSCRNLEGMNHFLEDQENVKLALRQVFEKVITDDLADADCKGCFVVNTTGELLPEENSFEAPLKAHKQSFEASFQSLLQRGIDSGQIAPNKDIAMLSSLLYTTITGLRVNGKFKAPLAESMKMVDAILGLLD